MSNRLMVAAGAAFLAVVLVLPAAGQGRGRGFWGAGRVGAGAGPGQGYGRGAGGWWNRVNPATPEQTALVQQVSDLHAKIRTLNWEIADLKANKGAPAEIAKREKAIAEYRAELSRLTTENEKLIREMGVPAPFGVCTGTGPRLGNRWYGNGAAGWRGNGLRLRDGSGPNPYCPLKK